MKAGGEERRTETAWPLDVGIAKMPNMVAWYSPALLLETGGRHLISGIFGQFADQRIMQATVDGFSTEAIAREAKRHNYSDKSEFLRDGAFWVDYVADLGDGFDSTYAIASLISADQLYVPGAGMLPGSRMLIMGGDQVYPYPSRQAYRERTITPYTWALPESGDEKQPTRRDLFVLPGNHDWYDGLSSFDFIFCKARYGLADHAHFGGWRCPQRRSYFAIRLPHNWWIWGADIQMSQYLDAGQVLYFKEVTKQFSATPTEPPKIILCIAEPSWQMPNRQSHQGEGNLDIVTNIALDAGARVCAVMAGDFHHYSRYFSPELGLNFVTSGGGGAYLAPTHDLKDTVDLDFAGKRYKLHLTAPGNGSPEGSPEACWPTRADSRRLSVDILAFPFRNYWFSAAIGLYYWIMSWLFAVTEVQMAVDDPTRKLVAQILGLTGEPTSIKGPMDLAALVLFSGQANPLLGLLGIGLFGTLWYYADPPPGRWFVRILMAMAHWWGHILMMIFLLYAVTQANVWLIDRLLPAMGFGLSPGWARAFREAILPPFEYVFVGGLLAGFVWGLYLTFFCLLGRHGDNAFSSMRVDRFKHFMRLKIEPETLTIYPIGLENVPKRSGWRKAEPDADGVVPGSRYVSKKPLKPRLIEAPIVVRVHDVARRESAAAKS